MRATLFILAALALTLAASTALAQEDWRPSIGFYADAAGTICEKDIITYNPATIYVLAMLGSHPGAIASVTGVEFLVQNLPPNGGTLVVTVSYASGALTIGNFWNNESGVAIAFPEPHDGPIVQLATVQIIQLAAGAIGANHLVSVRDNPISMNILIADENSVEHPANGYSITLNCSGDCPCVLSETPAEATSWSDIKSLY